MKVEDYRTKMKPGKFLKPHLRTTSTNFNKKLKNRSYTDHFINVTFDKKGSKHFQTSYNKHINKNKRSNIKHCKAKL
jgi:hypothetical protein